MNKLKDIATEFFDLVIQNWSDAVFKASANIEHFEKSIVASLNSSNSEVRSAAVAALNEANMASAHDMVVNLIGDADEHVRDEVLEYLKDFAIQSDAPLIFEKLKIGENVFMASLALHRLCPGGGETIDEEDSAAYKSEQIEHWRNSLQNQGLLT